MLAVISSRHKSGFFDQFMSKGISTDSVTCLSSITATDTIDNPIIKQLLWDQDSSEDDIFCEMKLEKNRLYSFKKRWPVTDIKPESLAAAGFFYLQQEDRVQCPFCHVIIYNWTTGDKPLREHMKKSPKCPFLVGSDVGNIPLASGKQNHIWLSNGHNNIDPFSSVTASPGELAECGLYYSGDADVVTCFFCRGSFDNWNSNDDAWIKHSKSPDCSFLAVRKSRHSASVKKNVAASGIENLKNRVIEIKGMLSCDTSNDIIQQEIYLFPIQLILSALLKKSNISSPQELCNEILDMEQRSRHEVSVGLEETNSTAVNGNSAASIVLCTLCMDRERGVVFQPCGHLITCYQCSNLISDCSVCHRPIICRIKAFVS